MTTYVFSLGLVPVQDWIVQARRARDLRAGSVLLWHLMAGVLGRLDRGGADLRLPAPPSEGFHALEDMSFAAALDRSYGLPNRVTGYLEAAGDDELREALELFEPEVVEHRWTPWRDEHLASCAHGDERAFWSEVEAHRDRYLKRVGPAGDCPFSVIWAALAVDRAPSTDDAETLRRHLRQVDGLFRQVKRSRPVRPWPAGARIGKCNQCGRREALGPAGYAAGQPEGAGSPGDYDAWRTWYAKLGRLPWVQRGARIKPGERLCWVCLAKRVSGYSDGGRSFPSTGDVAAAPWVEQVESVPELREALGRVRRTAMGRDDLGRTLHLDDETPVRAAPAGDPGDEAARQDREARQAVAALRGAVRGYNTARSKGTDGESEEAGTIPERPSRYLALLTFDGDGMGLRVQEDPLGVPAAMAAYASMARDSLERTGSATFYLAGDEGLAMSPASRALSLAIELEQSFRRAFDGCRCESEPTLSVGICFFEHTRPVDGAIAAARDALEAAKAEPRKHSLGVTVLAASGARWSVVRPFGAAWERIARSAELVRRRELAAGWAYDAVRLASSFELDSDAWRYFGDDHSALRSELRRRFRRAVLPRAGENATDRRRRADEMWLQEVGGESWWTSERGRPPEPWPEQFHLIGFLARQEDPAAASREA